MVNERIRKETSEDNKFSALIKRTVWLEAQLAKAKSVIEKYKDGQPLSYTVQAQCTDILLNEDPEIEWAQKISRAVQG